MTEREPNLPEGWGTMSDGSKHPDDVVASVNYRRGFNAGIQAAWEAVNLMVQTLPADPRTYGAKVMRDTALDIGDNILELKKRPANGETTQSSEAKP